MYGIYAHYNTLLIICLWDCHMLQFQFNAQHNRALFWVIRVNSRDLSMHAHAFEEEAKNSCHVCVLKVVVSMATWQMERVTCIGSKCVLN